MHLQDLGQIFNNINYKKLSDWLLKLTEKTLD